jgi:geranylgeranylglycerol-phosphate geranylgeranyltransferase
MKYYSLVELLRPLNGFMAGVGALVGLLVAGWTPQFGPEPFMALAVPFLVSSGGMVLNDYFDKEIDKARPIQRGEITASQAFWLAMILYAWGVVTAFIINYEAGLIALLAAAMLFMYDACLAKKPLIGNMVVAMNTALVFPFGAAFAGQAFTPAVGALFLMAFFSTLARETYKGIQDMDKDKGHRKTLAIVLGKKKSVVLAATFNFTAILVSPLPFLLGIFGEAYLLLVALVDVGFLYTLASAFKTKNFYEQSKLMKGLQALTLAVFLVGALS